MARLLLFAVVALAAPAAAQTSAQATQANVAEQPVAPDSTAHARLRDLRTIPGIQFELRYATANNFTGAVLPGYGTAVPLLRNEAAAALARVQVAVAAQGYALKVWDGYRPYRATLGMVAWCERNHRVDLLDSGYIARRSRHNQGVAIDLTLVDAKTGRELQMGTGFDTFSAAAHTANAAGDAARNRAILGRAMAEAGFVNYVDEWWHFSFEVADPVPFDLPLDSWSSLAAQVDSGSFRLHKFAQPIGWEHYTSVRDASGLALSDSFKFTDRGSAVPLNTSWRGASDLTPRYFTIRGHVSRQSSINDTVTVAAGRATMQVDGAPRTVAVPARFFTISGYAPVAMQQLLLQYWESHGKPAVLPTLPSGQVRIVYRGLDTVMANGGPAVPLRRYAIDGLIWGRETVWRSADGAIAALVSIDAEFDHFEAVRPAYEESLATFIARSASDGAAALAAATRGAGGAGGAFALVGATLIDGVSPTAIADAVVVVRDGKIVAAGPAATVAIPAGMGRINVAGKYIVPGLWDMHAHYEQVEWGPIYLASGVTTARDVGNERAFITGVRDATASGAGVGPRLLLAGVIDGSGPYALGIEQAATPERGVELVDRYHAEGFQQIKIYSSMTLPVLQAVTAEAHKLGMTVTGHIPFSMSTEQGINAGMDQVNHIQYITPMMLPKPDSNWSATFDNAEAQRTIALLKAHHTVLDPTLTVFEWSYHPARVPFSQFEPGVLKVAPALRPLLENTGVPAAQEVAAQRLFDQMVASVGALHRAGIPIVAGTDQVVPGYSVHREIELYVKAGFTPFEALQAATIVPARVMALDGESGSVEAGKRADLLVVDADPLADIANLRKVSLVVAGGRRYTPAPLWRSVGFEP